MGAIVEAETKCGGSPKGEKSPREGEGGSGESSQEGWVLTTK